MSDTAGLAERRERRIQKRHWRKGLIQAQQNSAEKLAILRDLRAMPLKRLRAIHKAAREAFKEPSTRTKKKPGTASP